MVVKAAAKAFDARKTNIVEHQRFAIQDVNMLILNNLADQLLPPFFKIMVS